MNNDCDRWYDTAETARYIDMSYSWVEGKRYGKGGPPFYKLGPKSIRYRKSDLDAWLEARRAELA